MPRQIRVNLSREQADELVARVQAIEGVTGVSVYRDASIKPPGDEVAILASIDATREIYSVLAKEGYASSASINSSELRDLYSSSSTNVPLDRESDEGPWEETGYLLRRETNPRFNFFLLMALSGAIAAVGLWQDVLHLAIGAMVIAPGYEPIMRIAYGATPGPGSHATQGLRSTLGGYVCLAAGAAITFLVLQLVSPSDAPLASRGWVQFWTSITPASVTVAILAGLAGSLAVVAGRSVLTVGAMIALALVPGMAIAGMALVSLDLALVGQGLLRWSVDAAAVLVTSGVLLWAKQRIVHRRDDMLRVKREGRKPAA